MPGRHLKDRSIPGGNMGGADVLPTRPGCAQGRKIRAGQIPDVIANHWRHGLTDHAIAGGWMFGRIRFHQRARFHNVRTRAPELSSLAHG